VREAFTREVKFRGVESGKAYSRNTLKSQTYYENDGNWIHLAEDLDFWKKEVVEKVKFHYNYRPMLSLLFQYLGSSLCHTSLFLLDMDAYQAYKDIKRYVRMSWIKDMKVKFVPRAVGFDHTPEHHIHEEEGIRLLTTSLEEFVQVARLYWESEVRGEKDRGLKKMRRVGNVAGIKYNCCPSCTCITGCYSCCPRC